MAHLINNLSAGITVPKDYIAVDRSFTYNYLTKITTPTVTVSFAAEAFDARDAFAAAIRQLKEKS